MTSALYSTLKSKLEEERAHLQNEIAQLAGMIAENGDNTGVQNESYGNHLADEASETFEQEKNLALERNLQSTLMAVEHALQKFEQGTYGTCDNCGQDINEQRLQAFPQAALCISCKEKQEAGQL